MFIVQTVMACLAGIVIVSMPTSTHGAGSTKIVAGGFDFGMVAQNTTVAHQVWVRSDSEDTIVVTDIKSGCGCLVASTDQYRLGPSDSLPITFYWQTRGSEGRTNKSAYLYTETDKRPLELLFTADVVTSFDSMASLMWAPLEIVFPTPGLSKELSQTFRLVNSTGADLAVTVIDSGPEIEIEVPTSVGTGQTATGQVIVVDAYTKQEYESSFTLELSGNQEAPYRVSIPVVSGDFSFRPIFTTTRK